MSDGDILEYYRPDFEDGFLFLWRLSSRVEIAYEVVHNWGFTPRTEIVWEKTTDSGKDWFGMGFYVRASHETCIVATRGKPRKQLTSRSIRSRFRAPVPRINGKTLHSGKPPEFYSLVERLVEGPYTELFARANRPGWVCSGKEIV